MPRAKPKSGWKLGTAPAPVTLSKQYETELVKAINAARCQSKKHALSLKEETELLEDIEYVLA